MGIVEFRGGKRGEWQVSSIRTICGEPLADVERVAAGEEGHAGGDAPGWILRGCVSNIRYAERHEVAELRQKQAGTGRPEATHAALIPIRKSGAWWELAQDERRAIFEETSHHTRIGMEYLPAIARRLHHCRDMGEPFDFLTWFEFAPKYEADFEALLNRLRATAEWTYVDREVDIRLVRWGAPS
jgi:chlorite dismutase